MAQIMICISMTPLSGAPSKHHDKKTAPTRRCFRRIGVDGYRQRVMKTILRNSTPLGHVTRSLQVKWFLMFGWRRRRNVSTRNQVEKCIQNRSGVTTANHLAPSISILSSQTIASRVLVLRSSCVPVATSPSVCPSSDSWSTSKPSPPSSIHCPSNVLLPHAVHSAHCQGDAQHFNPGGLDAAANHVSSLSYRM